MSEPDQRLRDLLLARHRTAEAQLDAARREIVDGIGATRDYSWSELLRALFGPQRTLWLALATVWLALAAIRFSVRPTSNASASPSLPPAAIAVWLAQHHSHETLAHLDRLD